MIWGGGQKMECRKTQELLSAYFDHELPPPLRDEVAQHVDVCTRCGDETRTFQQMAGLAAQMQDPQPPDGMWDGITAALDSGESASVRRKAASSWRRHRFLTLLATAALALLAVGIGWQIWKPWNESNHHGTMMVDMRDYTQQFGSDPQRAQQALLAKYDGRAIDLQQARRELGYKPAVAAGLPQRYSLEGVYVLKMPCCTCVQTLCRREDGKMFAIFEHDTDHQMSFSDHPPVAARCHGCPCSVVQADHGLIASWTARNRQLTVVGAHSLDEISDLISHFPGDNPPT